MSPTRIQPMDYCVGRLNGRMSSWDEEKREVRGTAVCLSDGTIKRRGLLPEETLPRYFLRFTAPCGAGKALRCWESRCEAQQHFCTEMKTWTRNIKRSSAKRGSRAGLQVRQPRWRTRRGYPHCFMCNSTALRSMATLAHRGADWERGGESTWTRGHAPSLFHTG